MCMENTGAGKDGHTAYKCQQVVAVVWVIAAKKVMAFQGKEFTGSNIKVCWMNV